MSEMISFNLLVATNYLRDSLSLFAATGTCDGGSFFGFPKWYKYLDGTGTGVECNPVITSINDIWLIVLAIVELLIRIAAIAAVIYIVYNGIRFITARGNPDKISSARTGVIDAIVGLLIAVMAIALVNFLGRSVS